MSDSEERGELTGLARGIDALFSDRPPQRAAPSDPLEAPEAPIEGSELDEAEPDAAFEPDTVLTEHDSVEGEALPAESAVDRLDLGPVASEDVVWSEAPTPLEINAEALEQEVEGFLEAPDGDKEGHADRIREIGQGLRESNRFDPLVLAVERLVLAAGDPPDPEALALAESLLSPAVTSRIVALLGAEKDQDRRARLQTVCVRLGHEMAVALSDALAETTDRSVRHACIEAMAAMGPSVMPMIDSMLEDDRWFVVRNAVALLAEVGGDRALEHVLGTLANSDGRVRREALQALATLGGDDAGQLAYGMLEDPDAGVRIAAAVTCGELKVERALKPLLQMLEDEKSDSDALVAILGALGQLADPGAVIPIEKLAVPTLFWKPRIDVRIAAYRALNRIGTPRARRLLNKAADDKNPKIKSLVREMLGIG